MECRFLLPAVVVILVIVGAPTPVWAGHLEVSINPDDELRSAVALDWDYGSLAIAIFVTSLFPFASLPGFLLLASASVGYIMFDLHILALLSAITMAATKQVFFLVSYGWRNAITQKTKNRMRPFEMMVKRYGSYVTFLAAAMPVFDDLVYVLLGLAKYSPLRFFVATLAGKLVLSYIIVFVSHYLGQSLFEIRENIDTTTPIYVGIIPFGASVVIMAVLLFKLDWGRVLGRFAPWTLDENNPDDGKT